MPRPDNLRSALCILGLLGLTLSPVACGKAPGSAGGDSPPAGGTWSPSAESQASRDIATLDLCSLVPVSEVASVLGHPPSAGSAKPTMGKWASDCTYSFEPGGGVFDVVMIWAYPPELWAPDLEEEAAELAGLGDAAYSANLSVFQQVNVLLKGDLYLDIRAGTGEQARRLAELAIDRVTANR